MTRYSLWVPGRPVPQGSKQAFVSKSTGRPVVVDKDVRLPRWRSTITAKAIEMQAEWMHTKPGSLFPISDPIGIKVAFVLDRPKSHFGSGRNADRLRPAAPRHPATMPDLDKLLRAIFDGLTDAQVWRDDAQVVWCLAIKRYSDPSSDWVAEGVDIEFGRMEEP